jgi:hypothetical protein
VHDLFHVFYVYELYNHENSRKKIFKNQMKKEKIEITLYVKRHIRHWKFFLYGCIEWFVGEQNELSVAGEEFIIGNNDGEDVGVTKNNDEYF